ncbi:suppressor of fused domain protein [Streptomyces gamaensis]|uniref:Suppressor of fused domain protein n=1 Tax=Streptomyces gamaensis TaxID=1763542 RepID=A0ABW0ZBL4_9ACTN
MRLIEHMENRLGAIVKGWTADPDSQPMPFQIGFFQNGVLPEVDTYATVGLSEHGRSAQGSERLYYQELVLGVDSKYSDGPFPALIHQLAMRVLQNGALLRGDVVGPFGPIIPGSKLEAFYSAIPVYYDDGFAAVDLESGNRAVMVWMVPISRAEAAYVKEFGWDAFESELVAQSPDLMDPFRDEIRLDK